MTESNRNPHLPAPAKTVRIAFRTTGCKVNQFDSAAVAGALSDLPIEFCGPDDGADIVVVNACTVTMKADRDGRAAANRAARTGAKVVMAGCLAQRLEDQDAPRPDGIIVVGGTADRTRLTTALREIVAGMAGSGYQSAVSRGTGRLAGDTLDDEDEAGSSGRSRPLIKIQDGCDCRCSYCIVPLVRGPSRSFTIDDITGQVFAAAASGAAEAVLTGVDLAAWGRRDDGRYGHLADLLRHLTGLGTGLRFRLSSLEPYGLDNGLVETIAESPDICPHLHIPMQSGSDTVLERMNRPYSSSRFESLVKFAADHIDGLVLGMDVIVGFPGETDEEFGYTRALVERLPTTYLHVFPYSPRPGTPAATAPDQVPVPVRRERGKILRDIAAARRIGHAASLMGRDIETVDIMPSDVGMRALAADYTRVMVPGRFDVVPGRRMVHITGMDGATVIGVDRS